MTGVGVAFATLFFMMAAHAALETARDALLLGSLSPVALLWSYVAIAALAALSAPLRRRLSAGRLHSLLLFGAAAPIVFWVAEPVILPAGAIAFYVYTALYVTLAVPRFWLLLAGRFTVREAKRFYTSIGLGGIAGAAAGSGFSAWLLTRASPRALLLEGAALYLLAALVARGFDTGKDNDGKGGGKLAPQSESRPYVRRLVWAALLASATFTVVDYLFKSVAANAIPRAELGSYFARTYTVINVVALFVQLLLAPKLIRRLGTHTAAAVLPAILCATSGGFALVGLPFFVLAAKGADGALRNSLHRVTFELFYFPLSEDARNRWKAVADAFGQRGGQALGALAVLALVWFGGTPRTVAWLGAMFAVGWLFVAYGIRQPYLVLFREGLRRGAVPASVPPLASDTLQAVLEAFSSADDAVVCTAIDFLAQSNSERLLPTVLLHHPSQRVVLRTLAVLARSRGAALATFTEPLLSHPDGNIRATALRVRIEGGTAPKELVAALSDESEDVRATAILGLLTSEAHRAEAARRIATVIDGEATIPKIALAQAIRARPRPELAPQLLRLLEAPVLGVRREVVRAMVAVPDKAYLSSLRPLLSDRRLMVDVRRAVLASCFGDSTIVEAWLLDESLPRGVRRHLPRTLSAFGTERAAAALTARLLDEPDGAVRFKIIRGLGRMRADRPSLPVDEKALRHFMAETLDRVVQILTYRVALATRPTDDQLERLLVALLQDKEEHALERVFRVLGVLQPELALEDVWQGTHSSDPRSRDAALELVETLPRAIRDRLLALLQRGTDVARLRGAGGELMARERALEEMKSDRSMPIRELTGALARRSSVGA